MADVTLVNGQVTDAVTQSIVTTIAGSPALAATNLSNASAQVFALMMQNAAAQQVNSAMCSQAAANQGVVLINAAGTMASSKLGQSDVPDNMLALLTALRAGTAPLPV